MDESEIYELDGGSMWKCLECGVDLGSLNPRQFCGKTKCLQPPAFDSDATDDTVLMDAAAASMYTEFCSRWSDERLCAILSLPSSSTAIDDLFDDAYELDEINLPKLTPTLSDLRASLRKVCEDAAVTDEEAKKIRNIAQHDDTGKANVLWLNARKFRITGTASAGSVGAQYEPLLKFVEKIVWGMCKDVQENSPALKWGNAHEADADRAFKAVMEYTHPTKKKEYDYPGLCVNRENPYLAMSPDGIVTIDGVSFLVEYKCPYSLSGSSIRNNYQIPFEVFFADDLGREDGGPEKQRLRLWKRRTGKKDMYPLRNLYPTSLQKKPRRTPIVAFPREWSVMPMPQYYYTQITHGLYTIDHVNLQGGFFVVWCPLKSLSGNVEQIYADEVDADGRPTAYGVWATPFGTVQITPVPLNKDYGDAQRSAVADFYFEKYLLPMLLKHEGCDDLAKSCIRSCVGGGQIKKRKLSWLSK